jgi:hypothetical protein
MSRPTNDSLRRDYIRDLVVDVRCARRDNMPEYAEKCLAEISALLANRHNFRIGKYGLPEIGGRS